MAALAAMRAGAGYVTVGAPASLELSFTVRLLEAMMVGLPEDGDGHLDASGVEPVLKAVGRADAVVLGPGLSKDPDAQALARGVVPRIDVPLVIDADGLNALAGQLEEIVAAAALADGPDPARGRARAAARGRLRGGRALAAAPRARGGGALEGVRRAQGRRHARRGAVRPGGDLARRARPGWPPRAPATCSPGVIGAMLAKGMPVAQGACAGRLRPRAGGADRRRAARAGRRDRLRRDRRAARGAERLTCHAADGARHHGIDVPRCTRRTRSSRSCDDARHELPASR